MICRQCSQFVTVSNVAEHEKQCDKKGKSKALMARRVLCRHCWASVTVKELESHKCSGDQRCPCCLRVRGPTSKMRVFGCGHVFCLACTAELVKNGPVRLFTTQPVAPPPCPVCRKTGPFMPFVLYWGQEE